MYTVTAPSELIRLVRGTPDADKLAALPLSTAIDALDGFMA
ncbi:hypothetical protein ACIRP3_01325 [Streptomyces sp. NPDC101209]